MCTLASGNTETRGDWLLGLEDMKDPDNLLLSGYCILEEAQGELISLYVVVEQIKAQIKDVDIRPGTYVQRFHLMSRDLCLSPIYKRRLNYSLRLRSAAQLVRLVDLFICLHCLHRVYVGVTGPSHQARLPRR
jgi:hypothetical protein